MKAEAVPYVFKAKGRIDFNEGFRLNGALEMQMQFSQHYLT